MIILVTKSSTVSTLREGETQLFYLRAPCVTSFPHISLRKYYRYCEYLKMYVNLIYDVQCDWLRKSVTIVETTDLCLRFQGLCIREKREHRT
jgi:hypothetical protein